MEKTKLTAILTLTAALSMSAFAARTTVTGILTDDMCTKRHMLPGKSNGACARYCVKHGAKYVIVPDGKVLEVTGKQDQLNELAGKEVKVTGEVKARASGFSKSTFPDTHLAARQRGVDEDLSNCFALSI